jgi:hypothetical protein
VVEEDILSGLPRSARNAIKAAEKRLDRAYAANDVEATVGSAKELIETVAKAVMDVAGLAYGSNPSVDSLASQTLHALELHPAALQGRKSLRQLSSSMIGAAQAIAELRNTDGTGHGRATPSNLDWSHALFIRDAGVAWCNWVLATARRTLAGRAGLDEAVADIGGARVFSRGALAAYLDELKLPELEEADQRKLGLSVARRWTVNETFMPLMDIVEPIADGDADYPPAFCEGIVEGLVLDHNGYIRTTAEDIQRAIRVGWRLTAKRRQKLFEDLADRIGEARPSSAFDTEAQDAAIGALRASSGERQNAAIRPALLRIAGQLEAIRVQDASP